MTIRFTKYLKDAAVFKPMDERITIEVTSEDLNLIISVRGFKETTKQGHYWKRTAYNEGEALDIMS